MGSQSVLLKLQLQRLSARGWNRQDLEQKRPWGYTHIWWDGRAQAHHSLWKEGRSEDTALRISDFSVFCLFILYQKDTWRELIPSFHCIFQINVWLRMTHCCCMYVKRQNKGKTDGKARWLLLILQSSGEFICLAWDMGPESCLGIYIEGRKDWDLWAWASSWAAHKLIKKGLSPEFGHFISSVYFMLFHCLSD